MKHVHIKIYGRVQGVGFRWGAWEKAKELGVYGFARNEADGSVYIEVEGDGQKIEQFVAWCRKGTLWSKVERVDVQNSILQHFTDFKVL